ncbi:MAG TPA: hydroxyacid dehydrogenase [Caldimonas sp.]|nr:hydroxyacid dehydrogenase [Caldimonas sp.]
MARVVICEFMDAPGIEALRARHDVLYDSGLVDDAPRLRALAADAEALVVRNRTQVRGDLLAALARCKVVGRLGVGLDNIDVEACAARGIAVIPAVGANARSVAEYVLASAMLLRRGVYGATADVVAGRWPREALSNGREIGGTTLGLVGFGSIGRVTAALAQGMGVRVIAHDAAVPDTDPVWTTSGVECTTLERVVADADIVSLHVPLLPSTRGLFDARRIAAMKPGAILVNAARGGIVDEAALAAALKSGHLGGAALDTFGVEPLPSANAFADCPNLLLTPHVAGPSKESSARISTLIATRVMEALA